MFQTILVVVAIALYFPAMVKTRNFRLGYISGFDDYSLGGAAISLALDRARDEGLMTNDTFR